MAKITLNIAKNFNNSIETIDKKKYFQLHKNVTTRSELFCFAIAVALAEKKEPLPLSATGNVTSLVRTEYMTNYDSLLSALYYDKYLKDKPDQIDDICNRDEVYNLAEKYANTGFGVIKDWVENVEEDTLLYKLISDMDKQYDEIKDELDSII